VRDALSDPLDPEEADLQMRRRNAETLVRMYEGLRNAICIGLRPGPGGVSEEAQMLRDYMQKAEADFRAANELPAAWEEWTSLLDDFHRLWSRVKSSCTL
jgi:hypothetical protein